MHEDVAEKRVVSLDGYCFGSFDFPGMSRDIQLKANQQNGVARNLYGKNTLLGHVIGVGKIFMMAATAMGNKRLGLSNKNLFVVPNHIIEQFASEFLQLYPSANLLVSSKKT
ncbi:hypothetical protein [Listeria booriae]|uniref:Helicase/UvrB N-terminal domain-containing protein n=1 Tax=Listeria booriae TaxID=1552123 RepID=A0A841XZ35_9LIST|nr:hypothetical protein [Listeria booriae]MBC1316920.1 hypothetical protein [Listeria booriae]